MLTKKKVWFFSFLHFPGSHHEYLYLSALPCQYLFKTASLCIWIRCLCTKKSQLCANFHNAQTTPWNTAETSWRCRRDGGKSPDLSAQFVLLVAPAYLHTNSNGPILALGCGRWQSTDGWPRNVPDGFVALTTDRQKDVLDTKGALMEFFCFWNFHNFCDLSLKTLFFFLLCVLIEHETQIILAFYSVFAVGDILLLLLLNDWFWLHARHFVRGNINTFMHQ